MVVVYGGRSGRVVTLIWIFVFAIVIVFGVEVVLIGVSTWIGACVGLWGCS